MERTAAKPAFTKIMIMRMTVASLLVALSVLSGVATVANASAGEVFGAKTAPGQVPSPN
jgi:hypothetical protein